MTGSENDNQHAENKGFIELLDNPPPMKQALLDKHYARKQKQHKAPTVKLKHAEGHISAMHIAGDNSLLAQIALNDACGTTSQDFQASLVSELMNAACTGTQSQAQELEINAAIATMHSIAPRDEIEAMLVAQMVATHKMIMRLTYQFQSSNTILQQNAIGNTLTKLHRTFTTQMEALNRYRGKGQQKVTVEHVHVHAGGQAIVGSVGHPEGGGATKKTEEQPHAKQLTHAPVYTMPCPDTQHEPMPVPCHA